MDLICCIIWHVSIGVVCTDLSGKTPQILEGVGKAVASGSLDETDRRGQCGGITETRW